MITLYLSYLFFLHILIAGGYNYIMAADGMLNSKQRRDHHYAATCNKSEINRTAQLIAQEDSVNHLDAIQIKENLINPGSCTKPESTDNQEKIITSFRKRMACIVPHYLDSSNKLIPSLKPFAKLYNFYQIIKQLWNKYIYDNWMVNLFSLIDAAHRYKLFA